MAKLPATSYVRMVDIWLIFTQLYPFLEVVLYTIIELYNEEEVTNHHGFKKDIPEEQRQGVHHVLLIIYIVKLRQGSVRQGMQGMALEPTNKQTQLSFTPK